jgi:hypothetical protein
MLTNVVPAWVKYLLLMACVAVGWWSFTGKSMPPEHCNSTYLTSGSSETASGFPAKAGANIRQFVTNPLEPTPLPDEGTVILRSSSANYYRDQP